jgi:signal recognition particle GTPase
MINKGENTMKVKEYATVQVEKQVDDIKDKLVNNEMTLDDAANKLENIENIGLITNSIDFDEMAYLLKFGD